MLFDNLCYKFILFFVYVILTGLLFQDGLSQCTLPTFLRNTVWIDSVKGELVFGTTNMTGWDLDYDGNNGDPLLDWDCFHTETDGSKSYIIFKIPQTIVILADEFNVFMCMELTKITEYSYYYYLLWSDTPPSFNYDRISGQNVNTTINDPRSQLCLDLNNPVHAVVYPHTGEYHVMIKDGSITSAIQECPPSFFGEYVYTTTDLDTNTECCGNSSDTLDVCTDYTTMNFNNTGCNTNIAYTENGTLSCLVSITSGDIVYHTTYNQDNTVDGINTFRFTCFVSKVSSNGSLQVSQTMNSCKKDQAPDAHPLFSNGTIAGLNIQLSPNRLCPKTSSESNDSDKDSGISTGAIIGITFGILIFIIVIIILVCLFLKCRTPFDKKNDNEKKTHKCLFLKCCCGPNNKTHENDKQSHRNSPRENTDGTTDEYLDINKKNVHNYTFDTSNEDEVTTNLEPSTSGREINKQENGFVENKNEQFLSTPVVNNIEVANTKESEQLTEVRVLTDENLTIDKHDNTSANGEIEVTRVSESKVVLRKEIPELNSTENLFSEYDPAMLYDSERTGMSKSDITLSLGQLDRTPIMNNRNPIKNEFEFTRDDSELNLRSKSKLKDDSSPRTNNDILHKSEPNILKESKRETSRIKSSLISGLSGNSFEWNFIYCSPYALTLEQKQAALDRKIKLQRKRKKIQQRKREEMEKKKRENAAAFEKWMQKKEEQKSLPNSSENILEQTVDSDRYKYWYPY